MFSKSKGTMGSFISILVFVACCGIMIADFDLWWLPICVLPFVFYFNIGYKGHWESDKVDEEAEKIQDEEPNTTLWPFDELETEPAHSKREELHEKELRRERKALERAQEETRVHHRLSEDASVAEDRAQTDRELRKERKAIEHLQEQAAAERLREEYDQE